MSELKSFIVHYNGEFIRVYEENKVDATIAKLKKKLEDVQASAYIEVVDAGMEIRKLRRALWLARAMRARDIQRWWLQVTCSPRTEVACMRWNNIESKCRAKAQQYK